MARETDNPIAAVLRILRGNTPQGVFASRLGIKQAVYSHYENKRREPSLDEVCRIARALGTTPNVLLGFEAPPLSDSATPREIKTGNNSPVAIVKGDHNKISQTINQPSKSRIRK
jgi:transcriptional regulator with XRE-family HTH domain